MREIDSDDHQRTLAEAYSEHVGDHFDYDEDRTRTGVPDMATNIAG